MANHFCIACAFLDRDFVYTLVVVMETQAFVVPFVSAILGGVVSFIGGFLAMRVELAVLRTEVNALRESLMGMKENIDEAHRRVDSWYQARRISDKPTRVR